MGINYSQYILVGTKVDKDSIKVIKEPSQYEIQNRYDTRTGKIVRQEKVLIKQEEYVFKFLNKEYDDIYEIENDFPDLKLLIFDEYIILGMNILNKESFDRVDLITGKFNIEQLTEFFNKVQRILPSCEINCYLDYRIG